MKKFIVIYYAPLDVVMQMSTMTKEQQAEGMKGWMMWAQKCGKQLADLGNPLMGGKALDVNGKSSDSKKDVTGYSVLEAKDMDEAISLLQGHPHIGGWNASCSIEVYEAMPVPGM